MFSKILMIRICPGREEEGCNVARQMNGYCVDFRRQGTLMVKGLGIRSVLRSWCGMRVMYVMLSRLLQRPSLSF